MENDLINQSTQLVMAAIAVLLVIGVLLFCWWNKRKMQSKMSQHTDKLNGLSEEMNSLQSENRTLKNQLGNLKDELKVTFMESKDDLKLIEGIGPVIENMLNKAGIYKWKQLKKEDIRHLKEIIYQGGDNFKIHDPSTWPKQADLADSGRWEELRDWQKKLKGGKVV